MCSDEQVSDFDKVNLTSLLLLSLLLLLLVSHICDSYVKSRAMQIHRCVFPNSFIVLTRHLYVCVCICVCVCIFYLYIHNTF